MRNTLPISAAGPERSADPVEAPPPPPLLVSAPEAARLCSISPATWHRLRAAGRIRHRQRMLALCSRLYSERNPTGTPPPARGLPEAVRAEIGRVLPEAVRAEIQRVLEEELPEAVRYLVSTCREVAHNAARR